MPSQLARGIAGLLADLLIISLAGFFTVIGVKDAYSYDDNAGLIVLLCIPIVLGLTPLCIQLRIAPCLYKLARYERRRNAAQDQVPVQTYILHDLNMLIVRAVTPWAVAIFVLSMLSIFSSYHAASAIVTASILTMGFVVICIAFAGVGDLMTHLFRSRGRPSLLWSAIILFWSGLAVGWPAGIMYGAESLLRYSSNAAVKIVFIVGWLAVVPALYIARARWKAALRECYNFR